MAGMARKPRGAGWLRGDGFFGASPLGAPRFLSADGVKHRQNSQVETWRSQMPNLMGGSPMPLEPTGWKPVLLRNPHGLAARATRTGNHAFSKRSNPELTARKFGADGGSCTHKAFAGGF